LSFLVQYAAKLNNDKLTRVLQKRKSQEQPEGKGGKVELLPKAAFNFRLASPEVGRDGDVGIDGGGAGAI